MKIYHNPRCAKSRKTLQLIKDRGVEPEVIEYLKQPLTDFELEEILKKLDMKPEQLIRKGEKIYKEHFKGNKLSTDQWILAMVENPILIERPIVVKGEKAVLGRPPENVNELF
ncbi:MAG: arsenate reductase (glutaredoxin) [Candidatus Cyclobacteriaceae bacterium M3_2C_046]